MCECVSCLLLSLTVEPEVEGSAFMAPRRDSVKSLTLDLYAALCCYCSCCCCVKEFTGQHKSYVSSSVCVCVRVRVYHNQVNALAKRSLVQFLNNEVVASRFYIRHYPYAPCFPAYVLHLYECVCVCCVCVCVTMLQCGPAACHKVVNAATKRVLGMRLPI